MFLVFARAHHGSAMLTEVELLERVGWLAMEQRTFRWQNDVVTVSADESDFVD
jgi:hypothetical protein